MKKRRKKRRKKMPSVPPTPQKPIAPPDLEKLPLTYQEVTEYFKSFGPQANPFPLRKETYSRIEKATGRPLICYVTKTRQIPAGVPAYIDDSDLTGFADLIQYVEGDVLDVLLISNGGSAEASERIVRLLRERFKSVRFLVPSNAYSAATLICFSGDEIVMGSLGTLGPIDPQINGVPARAILRAFENLEARLKVEGPRALTAYMPLISKYDLHVLEICKSAQELSDELARAWLSKFMLKCDAEDPAVTKLVDFFRSYDVHKSHGRSIDRTKAREEGLSKIVNAESTSGLASLLQSLLNQLELMFDKSPFYKLFEDARGINWGRQIQTVTFQMPIPTAPQPPAQP